MKVLLLEPDTLIALEAPAAGGYRTLDVDYINVGWYEMQPLPERSGEGATRREHDPFRRMGSKAFNVAERLQETA